MKKIFLLIAFLVVINTNSNAQFIGIGIRIPNVSQDGVGNGVIIGGGGGIPNNAMTFNGKYMLFNGAYMTFSGTP